MDISTQDAMQDQLVGHDLYKFCELIYKDDVHRDAGIIDICNLAYHLMCDTVRISQRSAFAAEQAAMEQYFAAGGFHSDLPSPARPVFYRFVRLRHLEYLKFSSAFELMLKSMLLEQGYLIHTISGKTGPYKALAQEQRWRPIASAELLEISDFRYNGTRNYLPGLSDKTLNYSTILGNEAYRNALGLPAEDLELFEQYRVLRNQIHFPSDDMAAQTVPHSKPFIDFAMDLLHDRIVDRCNERCDKLGLLGSKLAHLDT